MVKGASIGLVWLKLEVKMKIYHLFCNLPLEYCKSDNE